MQKNAHCRGDAMRKKTCIRSDDFFIKLYRVMRITTFLLIVCCVHLHATVLSQTVTMQGKSLSLKQVFSEIEAQTGYVVVYNAQALDKRMLAVSARKKPLLAFLDEVLVPGGLDFEI